MLIILQFGGEMQLYEVLKCTNKVNTIDELYNRLDLIIDLAKDDVYRIAKSKQIYFFDFDTVFFQASKALKRQLLKTHLRGIKRFFQCENTEQAINWLISRLLNNCQNLSQNRAFSDFIDLDIIKNEVLENQSFVESRIENVLMYEEITKLPREAIKGGLLKVFNDVLVDHNFDLLDFEELCKKFCFKTIEVIGYDPRQAPSTKAELTESGNSQLTLIF
jgi:hypothetical protein